MTVSPDRRPWPIHGWSLELALRLDDLDRGFLADLHRAPALQAQALYAAMAGIAADRAGSMIARLMARGLVEPVAGDDLARLARWLRGAEPWAIIEITFGDVPEGYLGALRRVGGAAMELGAYPRLHQLLTDPSQRRRSTLLRHVGEITGTSLVVIDILDPAILRPEVVRRVHSAKEAAHLNRALALLRTSCSTATDGAISESLARLPEGASLTIWLEKWARKADRLPSPIPEDEDLRPLTSGAMMVQKAREFRNCLGQGHQICEALLGYSFFVEWKAAPVIAELENLGDGRWLLQGLYGPRNKMPARDVANAIRAKLTHHGILVPAADIIPRDLQPVARLFGVYGRDRLDFNEERAAAEAYDI